MDSKKMCLVKQIIIITINENKNRRSANTPSPFWLILCSVYPSRETTAHIPRKIKTTQSVEKKTETVLDACLFGSVCKKKFNIEYYICTRMRGNATRSIQD